jgi:alkanesulfonate monooxygenase
MKDRTFDPEPRFGVWAPVYGTWGARTHPDEPVNDSSYRRTRALICSAERHGFSSTLLAQHTINPMTAEVPTLEAWTAAAALAEATETIEIIAAIKPLLMHPAVLAKLALGIDAISNGRFAINLVSAFFAREMDELGIDMPPHDERYALSEEWLADVRALWEGGLVDAHGPRYPIAALDLHHDPVRPGGPTVYFGGESEQARRLAARAADVFFINGRPVQDVVELIADMRARKRERPPLRFGLAGFVVARQTPDEAAAELERLLALSAADDRSRLLSGSDKEVAMLKVNAGVPRVGTNGGTLAGLVGSYDEVARRVAEFVDAGIELFMLQFQPMETEMERFGTEIIPRVKRRLGTRL